MHAAAKVRDTKAKLRAKKSKADRPSILTPTVIETMRPTAEVRGTKAMRRAEESTDDKPNSLASTVIETRHATARRDGGGKRYEGDAEGGGSKDVEPSTLTPTMTETPHAPARQETPKQCQGRRSSKMTSQALSRRR